jgi:hypothetical protein
LINGTAVSFVSTGDLPNGLTPDVIYYVRDVNPNYFRVSTTPSAAPINLLSMGTGTHTLLIGKVTYRYIIELDTQTGLLPLIPDVGSTLYLKAHPLYLRKDFNEVGGDLAIPNDVGPFLLDAFHGTMIAGYKVDTVIGLKTFDSFGSQTNLEYAVGQQWQTVKSNYLVLERPILSESLLFWQRIAGNFQFQQNGFFQAELDANGEFTISTDILVPEWPTDIQRGWVIPLLARVETKVVVQFEPQAQQMFTIPGNTLAFVRPKIIADPNSSVRRLLLSLKGSPNSRVEIRDWEFDGQSVSSLSYFLLGKGDAWGVERWMAGGFSIKPLFLNMSVLNAQYSDGVSKYNAGYIYS